MCVCVVTFHKKEVCFAFVNIFFTCILPACNLHVCLCITCVLGALEGYKRVSAPLGLELKVDVNGHVGAGN